MRPALLIPRVVEEIPFDTLDREDLWTAISETDIGEFPWHRHGDRQRTRARLQYSATHLLAEYNCEDRHSSSQVVDLNGPVWKDSCVELFFCPRPRRSSDYFNIEINACGTFLIAFGRDRHRRVSIDPENATEVKVWHSAPGRKKDESADDRAWRIVAGIPFRVLEQLAGFPLRPGERDPVDGESPSLRRTHGSAERMLGADRDIRSGFPSPGLFWRLLFHLSIEMKANERNACC